MEKTVSKEMKIEIMEYLSVDNEPDLEKFYLEEIEDNFFLFYHKCKSLDMDSFDANRYAWINTIIGYDIGYGNFHKLDEYFYCIKDADILDLSNDADSKEELKEIITELNLDISLDKWNTKEIKSYEFFGNNMEKYLAEN